MARTTGTSKRSVFEAAEVCSIVGVQPFVLRSWETEFPELGTSRGRSRVYRQADIELVLEIKRLLYEEGLTLGAARRQIDGDDSPASAVGPPPGELLGPGARERIIGVKRGLEAILGLLSAGEESAPGARRAGSAGGRRPRGRQRADAPAP